MGKIKVKVNGLLVGIFNSKEEAEKYLKERREHLNVHQSFSKLINPRTATPYEQQRLENWDRLFKD